MITFDEIKIWEYILDLHKALDLPPLKNISPFSYQLNSKWFMVVNARDKVVKFNGVEIKPYNSMFWLNGISVFTCSFDNDISFLKESLECDKLSKDLKKTFMQAISRETENQLKEFRRRFN